MSPKLCPDCDEPMYPADDMMCEKARFICPECAPDYALAHATTYSDLEPDAYDYDGVPRTPDDLEENDDGE